MSVRTEYIILLAILLGVIVLSMTKVMTSHVMPYNTVLFRNMGNTYEGFDTSLSPAEITPTTVTNEFTIQSQQNISTIDGINSLFSSPYLTENDETSKNVHIDTYSLDKGSSTCQGYGYFNSGGALCMTDEQKRSLTTRGGNSTGRDSQIGGP